MTQAKSSNQPTRSFVPVARSLLNLGDTEKVRLKRKFDVCFTMAKEGLAFEKYVPTCELEERHDVDIGMAYKTAPSASQFTHFIAQSQHHRFLEDLAGKKLYSFMMDSSTDAV